MSENRSWWGGHISFLHSKSFICLVCICYVMYNGSAAWYSLRADGIDGCTVLLECLLSVCMFVFDDIALKSINVWLAVLDSSGHSEPGISTDMIRGTQLRLAWPKAKAEPIHSNMSTKFYVSLCAIGDARVVCAWGLCVFFVRWWVFFDLVDRDLTICERETPNRPLWYISAH